MITAIYALGPATADLIPSRTAFHGEMSAAMLSATLCMLLLLHDSTKQSYVA
jgi:hypothetical protein